MDEKDLLQLHRFRSKVEVKKNKPKSSLNLEEKRANMRRLYNYAQMWNDMREFRDKAKKHKDYAFGKQWDDLVEVDGRMMREEENIVRQGKAPLKNNLIRQLIKTAVGNFRANKTEPQAISRERDEQKLGEMMSIALQYAHQVNALHELDAREFERFLISGLCMQRVTYQWDKLRIMRDVKVSSVNINNIFINSGIEDPRGDDVRCIGCISDYRLSDVVSMFAKNRQDAFRIAEIYSKPYIDYYQSQYSTFDGRNFTEQDFFNTKNKNLVRVIEAWELESKERIYCHDMQSGEQYLIEIKDEKHIKAINEQRMLYYTSNGVSAQEVEDKYLIQTEWMWDTYWYVRYLTPYGDVLAEMETPFTHKDHPFAMLAYPLVDGEIHSFVEDIYDQQRYINRLITLLDFIIGSSAKGVLVFPEDALGDMSKEEVLKEWVKYNGVIFAKIKPGMPMPQQISANSTNMGATELLATQMRLMQDISGIHGALQGKAANSGTAASLYAQESQNSAVNLLDLYETYNEFRKRRDYKMMKVIQQYYDTPRYINITGHDYAEESKYYDPQKIRNSEMDIVISESVATPAYRMAMNNFLLQVYQMGQLDLKTMLQHSAYPFSDKLIEAIDRKEKEMQQQQQAMMEQQQAIAQGATAEQAAEANPIPQGEPIASEEEINAIANNPKYMELLNQFIGKAS